MQEAELNPQRVEMQGSARPAPGRDPTGSRTFPPDDRGSLSAGASPSVQLVVLKSLDQATAFLGQLNQLLLALALAALAVAGFHGVFVLPHFYAAARQSG